jgi:hypothetical protein
MTTFNFEMNFSMRCSTTGYTIEAANEEEAIIKIESCIDKYHAFDFERFEKIGGDLSHASWNLHSNTDCDYEFDGEISEEQEKV